MKAKVFLTALVLALPCMLMAQETKHVLFVGNSYTEVNNLPQMVADVAASVGDQLTYSAYTPGGCTFQQHCSNQSMTLIRQGGWDAVVLQEQSQYPSFPDAQVQSEVFPFARRLVDSIYAHGWCTEPMFYMTWGRRDGDAYNAQFFPPLATYEGMDSLLCRRYRQMASDNDASVCPVGRVWHYLRDNHAEIELYQSDGSHPSVAGTYVAACAFYTMLFQRNPETIVFRPDALSPSVAQIIRQAVRTVVYDTLSAWQRLEPSLQVDEVDTPQFMDCLFDLQFVNCDTIYCSWGDGSDTFYTVAPQVTASHTYADTGLYTLTFTASRHCMNAEVTRTFQAVAETQSIVTPEEAAFLGPNPATDHVTVGSCADLMLYSLDGRLLRQRRHTDTMPLVGLPAGVYLLTVDGVTYRIIKR